MRAFRDQDPVLRPELRQPGAGAAVPDPEKVRFRPDADVIDPDDQTPLQDAVAEASEWVLHAHQNAVRASELAVDGAKVYQHPAAQHYEPSLTGDVVRLVVEVRLTKDAAGGERSRQAVLQTVQAVLDKSVHDHAVRQFHEGQPARVAGMSVELAS